MNRKFYLANNIKFAIRANLDGVYIPSFNKKLDTNNFKLKKNFSILGSAHNVKELRIKERQNVQFIFLSPIFFVPKSKGYLGVSKFNFLSNKTKMKKIALGGINKENIKKLKMLSCDGYASISLFKI